MPRIVLTRFAGASTRTDPPEPVPVSAIRRRLIGYLLVLPAFLLVIGIVIYPVGYELFLSLTNAVNFEGPGQFVGLENYATVLADPNFGLAARNTAVLVVVTMLIELLAGVLTAQLLWWRFWGRSVIFLAVFMPWAFPAAFSAFAWYWLLTPPFHTFYTHYALAARFWLEDTFGMGVWAVSSIAVMNIWRGSSIIAVFLLAGLNAIPEELLEYGHLETSGAWQYFWQVVAPLARRFLLLAFLVALVVTYDEYVAMYVESGGRITVPVIGTLAYTHAVTTGQTGVGAALALIQIPVAVALALLFFRVTETWHGSPFGPIDLMVRGGAARQAPATPGQPTRPRGDEVAPTRAPRHAEIARAMISVRTDRREPGSVAIPAAPASALQADPAARLPGGSAQLVVRKRLTVDAVPDAPSGAGVPVANSRGASPDFHLPRLPGEPTAARFDVGSTPHRVPLSEQRPLIGQRVRRRLLRVVGVAAALGVMAFHLFPLYYTAVQAIRPITEDVTGNPFWVERPSFASVREVLGLDALEPILRGAQPATLENIRAAIAEQQFWLWGWNTLVIFGTVLIIGLAVSLTAGYALARFALPGRTWLARLMFFTYFIPQIAIAIPIYQIFKPAGLDDNLLALILLYLTLAIPFATWLFYSFFQGLATDVEEHASLDSGRLQAFLRIVLPMSWPVVIAAGLFAIGMMGSDVLYAGIFSLTDATKTLPAGYGIIAVDLDEWAPVNAAILLGSLPILVGCAALSPYYVRGLRSALLEGT